MGPIAIRKWLISYARQSEKDSGFLNLEVMDDGGSNFDSFSSQRVPEQPRSKGHSLTSGGVRFERPSALTALCQLGTAITARMGSILSTALNPVSAARVQVGQR